MITKLDVEVGELVSLGYIDLTRFSNCGAKTSTAVGNATTLWSNH